MEDIFGKSERGIEKAVELSGRPVSKFDPARISVELKPIEVQAMNIIYNVINPEVAPDMKSLAKYLLARGMDSAFAEIRGVMSIHKIMGLLPPELRDLFEGFDKGGPKG